MTMAEERELFYFCRILFDLDREVSRDFLGYIQLSGVKTAYRKKVRETHPDLAAGKNFLVQRRHNDQFLVVQRAYESLTSFLEARDRKYSSPKVKRNGKPFSPRNGSSVKKYWSNTKTAATSPQSKRPVDARHSANFGAKNGGSLFNNAKQWNSELIFQGVLPARRLLFGHYLYYSGRITWRTIIEALVWQRKHKARIGEIGCRLGWLTHVDIMQIVRNRDKLLRFGESAIRLGLLTNRQLDAMLQQQKMETKKFGEYFLENRLMTRDILEMRLREFRAHNLKYSNFAA